MEQVVIEVSDKTKARLLVELLNSMDLVESVKTLSKKNVRRQPNTADDFFALAGIWADRAVDIDSIRHKAWSKRSV
jgi:hypothetical protein